MSFSLNLKDRGTEFISLDPKAVLNCLLMTATAWSFTT